MPKATVNNQHDYSTLRVVFNKDLRANLTISRYATKASGKGLSIPQMNLLLKAFDACRANTPKSYGEMLECLRVLCEKATDVENLVDIIATFSDTLKGEKGKEAPKAPIPALLEKQLPVEVPVPTKADLIVTSKNPTQEELQAAFDKVKNAKNWKARIDRTINKEDLSITLMAIAHFHGSMPYEVAHSNPKKVIVRSKGYAC